MIKLCNNYIQVVPLNTEQILNSISNSVEFVKEESSNWSGQFYTSSIVNKIIYRQKSIDTIQISENAGLGGLLEVIGEIKITKKDKKSSEISVEFQMGVFPIITPYILIVLFGIAGIFFVFIELIYSYILFGFMILFTLIMWLKQERVSFFLNGIARALDIKSSWIV